MKCLPRARLHAYKCAVMSDIERQATSSSPTMFSLAILTLLFTVAVNAASHGSISQPLPGTAIAPNHTFAFSYTPMADYSVSTFAYHVWLLDVLNINMSESMTSLFTSGHYFGKFDYPNYPAVPYPTNPAPAQLTMPDFSKNPPAGFAAGESAHDVRMQLLVIEEWGNGTVRRIHACFTRVVLTYASSINIKPAIGHRLQTSSVGIIYNATHVPATSQ
ncbi:hypothetical protein BC835DRAFT_105133 [Cytidiella melzeri]|nr:hypothetical protein BC835DRAFT_105133 [Cytidiella melzeri]